MTGQRLAGQVAIVTGASRGMGKGIALHFAREGASVAVVARTEAQWDERLPGSIHETVEEIRQAGAGAKAVAIQADLGRDADVERVVAEARAALGPISILVNNAAVTVPGRPPEKGAAGAKPVTTSKPTASASSNEKPKGVGRTGFLAFPLRGFKLHFDVGLFASYRLMQLVLPEMIEAKRGAIINITSMAAYTPGDGPYKTSGFLMPIAYGGNKAALHHLTQAVAYEMAPHGIVVNALSPSEPIITPGNLVAAAGETNWASPEDFSEATLRCALMDPSLCTGQILWSDDVLHPEKGHRGWLRPRAYAG